LYRPTIVLTSTLQEKRAGNKKYATEVKEKGGRGMGGDGRRGEGQKKGTGELEKKLKREGAAKKEEREGKEELMERWWERTGGKRGR